MKGVIMAGGFGTRMRPLTCNIPKPMVPIANTPIMRRIVNLLKAHGINDLVSLLYYQPEAIQSYFEDGKNFGGVMDYQGADGDMGTAGSVKLGQSKIGKERFMVISADVLTDFDLTEAVKFHKKNKAMATLVLTRVENPLAFGVVITDKKGQITRFLEKPSWGEVFSDTINTGIYILEPEVFDLIPQGKNFDFSKDLFPLMLEKKLPLFGYIASGYWKDIGTLPEYLLAHKDILHGKVDVAIEGKRQSRMGRDVYVGEGCSVDASAKLDGSVILGNRVTVGSRAQLANCIVGDDSVIGEDAQVREAVCWDHVVVGAGAVLRECTIAKGTRIGPRAYVGVGVVIADDCRIGSGAKIKDQVKIWPSKTVEDGAVVASSMVWGDKWSRNLFDQYGISGTANIEMTPDFASKLGAAYGAKLGKGGSVLMTRDAHKTSRMIDRAMVAGLISAGVHIHDLRVSPIPVARYATRALKESGGLHVRRSPLEQGIIDIKFFDGLGLDLSTRDEKSVENLYYREDYSRATSDEVGEITFPSRAIDHYREGFAAAVDAEKISQSGFKIVVDYAYGSTTTIFPTLLGALGIEVVSLNAFMDEKKLTRDAGQFDAGLKQVSNIVSTLSAQFGVMLDAGGQKMFVCDENGSLLDGDQQLVLMAMLHAQAVKGATVAVPVTASRAVEEAVQAAGGQVQRCGTTYRAMMEAGSEGASFVGEERGGYMFGDFFPCFDSMMGTAKLMEYLAITGKPLSEAVKQIPKFHIRRSMVACGWESKGTVMRKLIEDSEDEERELIDGVKIKKGKSWVLIIPDADKSFFHVDAEADSPEAAENLIEQYREKVLSWQRG